MSNCANIFTARKSERKYSYNNNKVLVQVHIPVEDSGRKTQQNNNTRILLVQKMKIKLRIQKFQRMYR